MAVELRHLRYFLALAAERHFDRAARQVGISQSALSQQIRKLEDELGVLLFARSTHGVWMTPAGRALVAEAPAALARTERAIAVAQRVGRGETGKLAVGFIGSAAHQFIPAALRTFRDVRPEVEVELIEVAIAEQTRPLYDERADLLFTRLPIEEPSLCAEPVLVDRLTAVVPADHRLASQRELELSALRDEPWLTLGRDDLLNRCAKHGFAPRVIGEAETFETLFGLVASGAGVSLVPAATAALRRPGVATIAIRGERITFALVWHEERRTPLVDAFLAVARTTAAKSELPARREAPVAARLVA